MFRNGWINAADDFHHERTHVLNRHRQAKKAKNKERTEGQTKTVQGK